MANTVPVACMSDSSASVPFLRDPAFRDFLQAVRETDNVSNWFYIARTWLYLVAVSALAVAGLEWVVSAEVGWGWAVPIGAVAIVLIAAGQHHLGVLGHEGSHRTLFRNRLLNEVASDWLCMFPIFTTTYMYRLQHLAHHQFVNDPDRDPNVVQMRATDTWPNGPLSARGLIGYVLKLFWLPHLMRFLRSRIKDNSMGGTHDVYRPSEPLPPRWPKAVGAACIFGQLGLNLWLVYREDQFLLAVLPAALLIASLVFFALLPTRFYHKSRVKPDITLRITTLSRIAGYFAVFHGLAWVSVASGRPALWYWTALWLGALVTAFPLYLVLRQLLQHGNGGRGRLDNTRVFIGPRTVNFFLLPLGQDYHLPHHLFASIPHYRLRQLHDRMRDYPEYRATAVEVEGVVRPSSGTDYQSILNVLGANRTESGERFIDGTVLDDCEVAEREAIAREEGKSVE